MGVCRSRLGTTGSILVPVVHPRNIQHHQANGSQNVQEVTQAMTALGPQFPFERVQYGEQPVNDADDSELRQLTQQWYTSLTYRISWYLR